ncbi:MAG TPA: response regulator [Candidatus Tectomicrobia bacterium]
MATILAVDYGREDFLALGNPLVSALRAWGYEVVEARDSLDVLEQARRVHPDAVVLYNTLPAIEALCTTLQQHVTTLRYTYSDPPRTGAADAVYRYGHGRPSVQTGQEPATV